VAFSFNFEIEDEDIDQNAVENGDNANADVSIVLRPAQEITLTKEHSVCYLYITDIIRTLYIMT
jgi:hypothetical protein